MDELALDESSKGRDLGFADELYDFVYSLKHALTVVFGTETERLQSHSGAFGRQLVDDLFHDFEGEVWICHEGTRRGESLRLTGIGLQPGIEHRGYTIYEDTAYSN